MCASRSCAIGKQRTEWVQLRKGVAYLFRYREVSLQANARYLDALDVVDDAALFKSLMAGEHCLHGFTNRDIRARLTSTQLLRSCADDPKKASAKLCRTG